MLFAVNTAHNGALKSEPLQAWANGVLCLPQMITPLCPQGQTTPFRRGGRMRLIHTHPKIIKSIHFVLFQLWLYASLLKYSERLTEKVSSYYEKLILLAPQCHICQCVCLRQAWLPSLLLNVTVGFLYGRNPSFYTSTNTMEHYVLIQAMLWWDEIQYIGVRGKFQLKL